jgi:hypothetical protein
LRPDVLFNDADAIYASAIGASVKPALVPADDTIYPVPSVSAAKGSAFVPSDDAVYAFTTTRFLAPALVANDDAIPAADVGWHLFVNAATTDVDHVFAPFSQAWNYVLPDAWFDEEHLENYPFFVHGLEGGIPVPRPQGLTGTVRPKIRLTGSFGRKVKLTGSFGRKIKLTGSMSGVRYGNRKR